MKQRIFQAITAMLLIITLTMANFVLLCANAISYAAEVNFNRNTNHDNVEFAVYFKDANGNQINKMDAYANSNDLKLYVQVSVNREGYFNGNIIVEDANFKLKTDILSEGINKIEDNMVYLNQINAGDSKEFEIGIELLKDAQFDLKWIDMESRVAIQGYYRNSSQKDISIYAKRNVSIKLDNPYVDEENIVLEQEIITNKVINFDGENKRVIQIQINSGVKNNLFPIKEYAINVNVPKISNKYPENIMVNANNILTTNGKDLSDADWKYDSEKGLISINIRNYQENNQVSWIKDGEDKFIITYIFDKDTQIKNEEEVANSEIYFYDNRNISIEKSNKINLDEEEKDAIVTTTMYQNEQKIYKGKLEAGNSRDISYRNIINVNLNKVAKEIIVEENDKIVADEILNLGMTYRKTTFNKDNVRDVLGNQGKLNIINADTREIIATIDNNTESNENNNVIVSYPSNVRRIMIKLDNPENIGQLEIENTRTIENIDANIVDRATEIYVTSTISYVSNRGEEKNETINSNIELINTETAVDVQINRNELSAMTSNDNVEARITLNSKNENNKLFNSPKIFLQLPNKFQDIKVNSINLLYEDEIKITSATLNENKIEINFEGRQTRYKDEAIDGAIIIINLDLLTNKKLTNSTEQINVGYENNTINGIESGVVSRDINIVSYAGVITTNQIPQYGIDIINNQGENSGTLPLVSDEEDIEISKQIINNKGNKISDVKILGTYPTKAAFNDNTIETAVSEINVNGISTDRVKMYYTENSTATEDINVSENKWSENIDDSRLVKKYLIVIDELDNLEEVDLTYKITIPAGLEYSEVAEEGYEVIYKSMNIDEKVTTDNIKLSTPRGTVVDTALKAVVSGEESDEVKENGILRYALSIANVGSEDVSDVKVFSKVPEGTTYINSDKIKSEVDLENLNLEDEDKREVEFDIDSIPEGEEVVKYFEVKVNDGMANKKISNAVTTSYGEISKTSNEVVTSVSEGKLDLQLVSVDADNGEIFSGYAYRYVLDITNKSNKAMKNVKTTINASDVLEISELYYIDSEDNAFMEENSNSINIEKIDAGETIQVAIYANVKVFNDNSAKAVSMIATSSVDNVEYKSNEVNLTAKSNLLFSMKVVSENSGNYVQSGDIIKYNVTIKNNGADEATVDLNNWIPNDITITKILKNGVEISDEDYTLKIDNDKNKKVLKIENNVLDSGKSIEYQIEAVVNFSYGNTKAMELISEYELEYQGIEIATDKIEHYLQPDQIPSEDEQDEENSEDSKDDNNNNKNNYGSNENRIQSNGNAIISGTVWVDENEDGQRQNNEETLQGINVKLLDTKTNKFLTNTNGEEVIATTTDTGFYSFDKVITDGEYLVVFDYDNTKYGLTAFKKEGISEELASNVITKDIEISGIKKNVAATEIIKVNGKNISNINMGLVTTKKYDLKLDKYISKVTAQNNKTVTNSYDNQTLVKHEIDAKQVSSTTVIVEYTIKVTNNGDVPAYVRKIADYLSTGYKFNAELNKDWYQSGNNVYCTSLANVEIQPGESKEVKLIAIKEMNESNTGLVNNMAEIVSSYNEYGLKDINSTEDNQAKGEDDLGSADLIISIKTGQVVTTIVIIISIIVVLGIVAILIKKYMRKRMI